MTQILLKIDFNVFEFRVFSFYHTKIKKNSLSYNLPIARGRMAGFVIFPKVLALYEMQATLSRIWTQVAVSISFNNNHYTTNTSEI